MGVICDVGDALFLTELSSMKRLDKIIMFVCGDEYFLL